MRRRVDFSKLSKAMQRPGIDPREHISLAVVERVIYDSEEGIFADVTLIPSGVSDTAVVGSPYAGNQFGDWCPLHIDDIVLVATAGGDSGNGPVVVSRFWRKSDKPASQFKDSQNQDDGDDLPINDRVIVIEPGQNLLVQTSEGGKITLRSSGSGNLEILVNSGKVFLGDTTATEPVALATTLKTYLDTLRTWLDAHVHTDPVSGLTSAPTVPSPSVPTISAQKVEAK